MWGCGWALDRMQILSSVIWAIAEWVRQGSQGGGKIPVSVRVQSFEWCNRHGATDCDRSICWGGRDESGV